MKNNVAYIIGQFENITGHAPVKKELQKTVFLIEKKGVGLGFTYMLHFYGPYCAELDHATVVLNSDGVVNFTYEQYGHRISIADKTKNIESDNLTEWQKKVINDVISHYKNMPASFLELLTTAIYVYDYTGAKSRKAIIDNVKRIKGDKFNDSDINTAINEFSYFDIPVSA